MLAAIDVGSNTLRLLLGDIVNGQVIPVRYARRITRLGGGMTPTDGLTPAAMARTLAALHEFADICTHQKPESLRAVGTAAMRSAVNGEDFAAAALQKTGIPLEIIGGQDEAQLTANGVLSALEPVPEVCLIVDIGGGSTEFILVHQGRVCRVASHPLGVVRLMEDLSGVCERAAFIATVINAVVDETVAFCRRSGLDQDMLTVAGTAGTVTTLAALDQAMTTYDWRRVNNVRVPLDRIRDWYQRLLPLTIEARESLPGMEAGRGDLIIAGIEILLCLLDRVGSDYLIVSDFGILEGVLLSMGGVDREPTQN